MSASKDFQNNNHLFHNIEEIHKSIYNIENFMNWQINCINEYSFNDSWIYSENLLIVVPTSGGKSIVADIISFKNIIIKYPKEKILYVFPYIALMKEKSKRLELICKAFQLKLISSNDIIKYINRDHLIYRNTILFFPQ